MIKRDLTLTAVILILGAGSFAGKPTPANEAQGGPSTVVPVPSRLKKFMPSRHNAKREEARTRRVDFVMIGDSITHNWESQGNYAATFAESNLLNLGFAGDRTQNVLWRIQHGAVDGISPKLVTLMIGTNHAHLGKKDYPPDTPEDILAGIQAIVAELRSRLPNSKIIVFSAFPRKAGKENGILLALNRMLPKVADDKQVFQVDINRAFLDAKGSQKTSLYSRDRLHLSPSGYTAWAKAMQPILEKEGVKMNPLAPLQDKGSNAPQKARTAKKPVAPKPAASSDTQRTSSTVKGIELSRISDRIKPATTIWFRQPAANFHESLVLGNGRIGAAVFGGPDEEQIVLNESSVWSGSRVDNDIPGGYKHLPEIRRLLAEENYTAAGKLTKEHFSSREKPVMGRGIGTFGRYQNLGNLHLTFSGNAEPPDEYWRELDLASALGTVAYRRGATSFRREHLVSAPDDVFVSRLTGPVSFTVTLDRPERFETKAAGERELLMTGTLNDGKGGDGLSYAARLRVVGGAVKVEGNKLAVSSDDEVLLLFAAATDYRGMAGRQLSDPVAATIADLDNAQRKSFAQLRSSQKADHEKHFNRVTLSLPETEKSRLPTDERLASYRQNGGDFSLAALFANLGRYLLVGSSRPGGLPANLQGIWADEIHTMWNGDWHFNINVQMNYWPALVCNMVELHEPMVSLIRSLVEPGNKTAKAYYDAPGWIAHRATNPWGYTSPGMMDLGSAAWLCEHLWEQYAFSPDRDYLKDVYPIMKGSAEFFLDQLWEGPDNNWLVTGPSKSSETAGLTPNGERAGICYGPTMDMQALRQLFANTLRAAEILGVDTDLQEELREKRPRLAPNQIGPDGRIQEWIKPYEDSEPTHRHLSPLYGLYPYYEITPEATPELAGASRRFLEKRGVGQSTAWANAWKINLWARLGDSARAHDFVHQMLVDNTYDNLLSRFRPQKNPRERKIFMIDANFGYTAGVTEMLMQSHGEVRGTRARDEGNTNTHSHPTPAPDTRLIRLLPALPEAWPEGKVTGLLARGGFEVDIEWKEGKLVEASIKSLHGTPCELRYGARTERPKLKKGESCTVTAAAFGRQPEADQSSPGPSRAGGYSYRLPSFETGSRVLFQGDSITDMKWGRKQSDRNHYLGHSYVYLIAARLGVEMPEAQLDVTTRGNSGNTVADLRRRWQKDAIDMKPDVLTILVGTNDVGSGLRNPDRKVTPAAFEADYRHILDASRKANPDLRLVLMDPFVLQSGRLTDEQAYRTRRSLTDRMRAVVAKLAKEFDAVHIKTQDIFDAAAEQVSAEHWLWDGIHPLPQGHELIARHWLQAVSARWPKALPE